MDIQERPASKTAIGVAVLRAMHELYDSNPKILQDPVIPLLLDNQVLQNATSNLQWLHDPRNLALRSHVVLRSRYAEDSLREAVLKGCGNTLFLVPALTLSLIVNQHGPLRYAFLKWIIQPVSAQS